MQLYSKKFELMPFGFHNMGATCYFNAMLQSLLSCTSFTQELIQNTNKYNNNPVAKKIIELIKLATTEITSKENTQLQEQLKMYSPTIWQEMIKFVSIKNKISADNFMKGQQCAREGFHYLMDSLEEFNDIRNLFLHRYKNMIHCFGCKKWVSDISSVCNLFEVQPDLKTEQLDIFKKYDSDETKQTLNKFLIRQTSYVDKFYMCPNCKNKDEKYKITELVMIPEILVVLSKKYISNHKLDIFTDFPKTMEFAKNNNDKLKYEAVSQIEHSGGLDGGHYWSVSRRKGGWFNFNDNCYTSSTGFIPTNNTYIVFYHLI
jgi:ubiquitin C-terminal hydrolase